jgi:hypothetical protein
MEDGAGRIFSGGCGGELDTGGGVSLLACGVAAGVDAGAEATESLVAEAEGSGSPMAPSMPGLAFSCPSLVEAAVALALGAAATLAAESAAGGSARTSGISSFLQARRATQGTTAIEVSRRSRCVLIRREVSEPQVAHQSQSSRGQSGLGRPRFRVRVS